MKLEKRLEILEEQYLLMQKYHTICISDGSTIDYSNADYNRENMLIKKIAQTREWIEQRKQKNNQL